MNTLTSGMHMEKLNSLRTRPLDKFIIVTFLARRRSCGPMCFVNEEPLFQKTSRLVDI